ncbi:MAG: hypothetical protein ACXQS6_00935 [Candidatus Syntropharchaeales archaeon]
MDTGQVTIYRKFVTLPGATKFYAVLDDASRKILAAGEFQNANTVNSTALVDEVVAKYWDILPIKELISDNGSEFGAHRKGDRKEWESRFKSHLDSLGIKLRCASSGVDCPWELELVWQLSYWRWRMSRIYKVKNFRGIQ